MIRSNSDWFDVLPSPRNWSFTIRLTLAAILLVIGTVTSATILTTLSVRDALTKQIGENFAVQAESLSDLVEVFFLEKGGQIQALAVTDVIKEAVKERNASYTGTSKAIENEIRALDTQWQASDDDDPLIANTVSQDAAINAAAAQLRNTLDAFPDHTEIFVTDRHGATIAATGRLSDYYQADEEWWQKAWNDGQGAVYISDPVYDQSAGVNASLIALPIFASLPESGGVAGAEGHSGEVIGIIRSTLVLDSLYSSVITDTMLGKTGYALLFDKTGHVLFEPSLDQQAADEEQERNPSHSEGLSFELRQSFVANKSHPKYQVALDEENEQSLFGYAHLQKGDGDARSLSLPKGRGRRWFESQVIQAVGELGWATVIRQKSSEAFVSVNLVIQSIQVAGFFIVTLSVVLAVLLARTITRPLQRLTQAAEEIGQGNLDVRFLPAGHEDKAALPARTDEVGRLTTSFEKMTTQLRELINELKARSAELTTSNQELESEIVQRKAVEKALQGFTDQLQSAAELTKEINAILDLDELLTVTVSQLHSRFDLYHVHIYLLHKKTKQLIMHAGSGEVGAQLRAKGHAISYDQEPSLVARAAREQKAIVSNNVQAEPTFLPNPLLPDTGSEVAIPLLIANRVLGVLDVQEKQANCFSKSDLHVLSALAGQIATALENARLFYELNQTADKLREIDRLKSEFLASMSHELRTPLNSIIGYSQIMLMGINGPLNQENTEDLQAILHSGRHLLNLINDILDLAKIEAGRMSLQFDEVNILALFDDIQTSHASLLQSKPVKLVLDIADGIPIIQADPLRLTQILSNLLSNAIKFTDQGHIYLRARHHNGKVLLAVQDEGIGISQADLSTIFEEFRQVDGSSTRRAQGTGLGLAITNRLVQLHRGTITVESQLDVGSTFTIYLPTHHKKS